MSLSKASVFINITANYMLFFYMIQKFVLKDGMKLHFAGLPYLKIEKPF